MVKIDKEVEVLEYSVTKMGNKVIRMHEKLLGLYTSKDTEQALEIIQSDGFINNLEEEINDIAISVFALLSPVASDLRKVITAIKIASELERIGDYAKNIASYIIKNDAINPIVEQYMVQMEELMIAMLKETMNCYSEKDVELAFEIPQKDKEIDLLIDECFTKLEKEADQKSLKAMLRGSQILRNIERAGDHTINICEHIIYCVKGQHYDFG